MSRKQRAQYPDAGQSVLNTPLPKRAQNALWRNGIRTLAEAAEWSDRDLLSLPHFGRASVAALRRIIGANVPMMSQ